MYYWLTVSLIESLAFNFYYLLLIDHAQGMITKTSEA